MEAEEAEEAEEALYVETIRALYVEAEEAL